MAQPGRTAGNSILTQINREAVRIMRAACLLIIGNDMRRLIQMNFEQSEIIETTPEFLLHWLETEAKALKWPYTQSLEFREEGKTTLVTMQYPRTTKNNLKIEATASVAKDNEKVTYGHSWGVVIEFDVNQLSSNTIHLTGGYKNYPGIKDHYDLLWKNILNVFPRRTITDQGSAEEKIKRNDWVIQGQPTTAFDDEGEDGPWSSIVDDPRGQVIVRLLHMGQSSKEIAYRVDIQAPKTVDNILSDLRKRYGKEVVPYRKPRRNL